jgi:hypothetical protein
MFADDHLLFGEASEKQMKCVIDTLNQFCNISGQEVSIDKTSILFSKNVERSMRMKLLQISGFEETTYFGKYLGVPLIGRAPKRANFQYIIDQASTKLSITKANQLSFAGRVALAKSVIEAVPIYPMMSSKIPKSCLDEIQMMQRQFIWGDMEQKRRFHAVGWDKISVPKWLRGLGLRKLDVMNKACLLKLDWKLQCGSNDYSVLRGKYDDVVRNSDSSFWKELMKLRPMLENFTFWHVGNGSEIDARVVPRAGIGHSTTTTWHEG